MAKKEILLITVLVTLALAPFYFAHMASFAEITSDPAIIKITVEKGKSISIGAFLKTNTDVTVTPKVSNLIEENSLSLIPLNDSTVVLSNATIKKTELPQIKYTVAIPQDQLSGVYSGNIVLDDQNGSTTEIPLQITVVPDPDYLLALEWILGGASVSVVWTALNDYNNGKKAASSAQLAGATPHPGALGPVKMAIFRGLATGVGAVLAAVLTYNQFIQTNANFSEGVFGGALIAFAWGFGAHQVLDNVIEQSSQALGKSS